MSKRVGVILSGCGFLDGSEIHESVFTLYFLSKYKAITSIFAPDINQMHVINHTTKDVASEVRNVLIESARIARGKIQPLAKAKIDEIDAVILPGGFGAAKNLSNFATKGSEAELNPQLKEFLAMAFKAKKPVGAICISPALIALFFKGSETHPLLSIGNDTQTAKTLELMGAKHKNRSVSDIEYDEKLKIVTTPAYMFDASIAEVGDGIEKLVKKILAVC